jgi:acyl-coenzyme A synthetase/AMP-(fatty) acid ligase
MKPGSCGPGVLGVYPVIYDEDGTEVPAGSGILRRARGTWSAAGQSWLR